MTAIFDKLDAGDVQSLLACALLLCYLAFKAYRAYEKRVNVPIVGWGATLMPWPAAIWNIGRARSAIQQGYDKYKDYAFQIPTLSGWEIFICDEAMIKEYRNLDSDLMSVVAVTAESFQTKYTLPYAQEGIHKLPPPLIPKVMNWLRMRAAARGDPYFSQFYEECLFAFNEEVSVTGEDWTVIPCFETATRMFARLTARALVGFPRCRDAELVDLFCKYGEAVPTSAFFIARFPAPLKPVVASLCSAPRMWRRLQRILLEICAERRANKPKTPNDVTDWLLSWVHENAATAYSDQDVTLVLGSMVFAAIHTTSQLLVHSLFELASRQEYVGPLRKEVFECVAKHGGWNKDALEAMRKLDSFVRESQRCNPVLGGSLARHVQKDFTFSNGLRIPAGNWISAPNSPVQCDPENYPDPQKFDGFRHARLREEDGQGNNHTLVSVSKKNLEFGDGRHSCPGRYMAADEIRTMVAHILVNYDVAIENHGQRPANMIIGKFLLPNLKAKIMLRRIHK